jgi:hypothetical protein
MPLSTNNLCLTHLNLVFGPRKMICLSIFSPNWLIPHISLLFVPFIPQKKVRFLLLSYATSTIVTTTQFIFFLLIYLFQGCKPKVFVVYIYNLPVSTFTSFLTAEMTKMESLFPSIYISSLIFGAYGY